MMLCTLVSYLIYGFLGQISDSRQGAHRKALATSALSRPLASFFSSILVAKERRSNEAFDASLATHCRN